MKFSIEKGADWWIRKNTDVALRTVEKQVATVASRLKTELCLDRPLRYLAQGHAASKMEEH